MVGDEPETESDVPVSFSDSDIEMSLVLTLLTSETSSSVPWLLLLLLSNTEAPGARPAPLPAPCCVAWAAARAAGARVLADVLPLFCLKTGIGHHIGLQAADQHDHIVAHTARHMCAREGGRGGSLNHAEVSVTRGPCRRAATPPPAPPQALA